MEDQLTVFTIADASHIPGVVGLVESLRDSGFAGPICVGAMDAATSRLDGDGLQTLEVNASEDAFPGNLKPALVLEHKCTRFLYLDADIVVTNPGFLERILDWIDTAPVFAAEAMIAPSDYRRHTWGEVIDGPLQSKSTVYYNSGMFAGAKPRDRGLLRRWEQLNETVIDPEDRHRSNEDFPMPDQDTLNAILQRCGPQEIVSIQPPDWWNAAAPSDPFFHVGGFAGSPAFLHCTTSQKPWLLDAIPPRPPNRYERTWVEHVTGDSTSISHEVSLPLGIRRWLNGTLETRIAVKLKQFKNRFFPNGGSGIIPKIRSH